MSDAESPIRAVRWEGRVAVLTVAGDVDLSTSKAFQAAALEVMDRKPSRVVVNLGDVPYMDSSGLASLVKLLSRARKQGGAVCLTNLNDLTRGLLEVTRLDSVFEIFATEQEALASS